MPIKTVNPLKRSRKEDVERASKRSKSAQTVPKPLPVPTLEYKSGSDGQSDDDDDESGSDDDEEDEDDDGDDPEAERQAMLAALEAHGRAMFASLNTPTAGPSTIKPTERSQRNKNKNGGKEGPKAGNGKRSSKVRDLDGLDGIFSEGSGQDSELEEGEGFDEDDGDDGISDQDGDDYDDIEESEEESLEDEEEEVEPVETVVFGGNTGRNTLDSTSKADFKRFMSSKSSKMMDVKKSDEDVPSRRKKGTVEDQAEDEEDRSNAALDKELHGLLMTSLLPSATTASKPSEKRNQMSSRLLELASIAGLGEGSSTLKSTAYKTQPTKIRSNILKAQERRTEKTRAEAQASGSWVKGSGGLGDIGKDKGLTLAAKKRQEKERERRSKSDDRGLSMGVGRFKGGVLTLSKSEIAKGSAVPEKFSVGKKKGKGGKKGGKK